jgi:acyl-CoA thioesterase
MEQDQFAKLLGIELVDLAPGTATVRMPVREDHYNGVGIVHGGAIFTLADFAFAAASNSRGKVAVAINAAIAYAKAAKTGTLTARAEEVTTSSRLGTYLVRITNDEGAVVAQFQGTVFRKDEPLPMQG